MTHGFSGLAGGVPEGRPEGEVKGEIDPKVAEHGLWNADLPGRALDLQPLSLVLVLGLYSGSRPPR